MQISEKARFVLLRGVFGWGVLTALMLALADWSKTHHFESPIRVVVRFVISMICGIPFGLFLWRRREAEIPREMTPGQKIGRAVILIGLVLALVYALMHHL
jgi:hypothetical protein